MKYRYPAEAVVFEVFSQKNCEYSRGDLEIGDPVEGAGPCCIEFDRAWQCGVLVLNGVSNAEDEYQWASNLRPLTKAARQMMKLSRALGRANRAERKMTALALGLPRGSK